MYENGNRSQPLNDNLGRTRACLFLFLLSKGLVVSPGELMSESGQVVPWRDPLASLVSEEKRLSPSFKLRASSSMLTQLSGSFGSRSIDDCLPNGLGVCVQGSIMWRRKVISARVIKYWTASREAGHSS
jgi:hypothetical protein